MDQKAATIQFHANKPERDALFCFLKLILLFAVVFFRFTSLNKDDPFERGSEKTSEYILTVYFDEINFFLPRQNSDNFVVQKIILSSVCGV